jgi:general secretion pathway protein D
MFRKPTLRLPAIGSTTLRAAALAAVIAVAPLGSAQNPFEGGQSFKPWAALKLNPKTRLKLDYRNASIDAILAMYQRASGVTIVKDPSLTGPLSISSAKAVPLDDAFQILKTTLGLKGYDMRVDSGLLVISKKDTRGGGFDIASLMQRGGGGSPFGDGGEDNQPLLTVYPVTYANASQIARIINEVFADSGSQNFGGIRFGDNQGSPQVEAGVQGPGGGAFQGRNRGGGGGGFGGGGFGGGQQGRIPGGFNFGRSTTTLVKASSDDYSNQVIVSAPQRFQSQVRDIIRQLDKVTDTPVQTKVYHLQYAAATDAATLVQSILNANVPRGRGGATTSQTGGAQGFISALRGQQAGSGTATADSRTNNVVVTATPENIKTVDQIIKELDLNVPSESTTFVFQLNNAKADDVATLLQSAFGTRTGVNGARGNTGANRTGTTANRNNTNTNNRGGGGGGGLGAEIQGNEIDLALADPNAQSGELATSVGVTQGFGQGFFGGGQNRGATGSNSTATTGRGANGQVVNTRDLSNQVTAIADPNTNSIIVVTSPENAAIIRSILDQLDKIPEQVLIETVIVEASLTANDKLGVEWNYSKTGTNTSNLGTGFDNTGATNSDGTVNEGFKYTLTGTNYSVFLNALRSDTKFQVLSTPKIFTSNNVEAEINISQSIPYITSSRQDVNGNFTYSYSFQDVGVVLTVTPRITSNGMVTMQVNQTANDLQGYTTFNAPIINQRQANTTVSVKDGETIILGGIIRKTINTDVRKVPLLGDIPLLGNLFRSNSKTSQKTELLVFLTPRVVRDPDEARKLREENERKMSPETNKSLNDYIKTGNNDKLKPPVKTPPPVKQP